MLNSVLVEDVVQAMQTPIPLFSSAIRISTQAPAQSR
jgi:hypothetical protein